MSSAQRVPLNTDSTRGIHFKRLLGSSLSVVGGAVAAAIVFTIGAATQNGALMLGGPVAVALVVIVACWFVADRYAEDEFFRLFAQAHGLNHWKKWSLQAFTPLLGAGDRRRTEHWMESDGRGIGWYTFEVRHEGSNNKDTWEPHPFTVATVDVGEYGMRRFQGVFVRRRRGIFDKLDTDSDWLSRTRHKKKLELESTEFCERYELWADEDQDEIHVRQLFAPSFVLWMAQHPLEPGFELKAGTVVVFIPKHCGEAGKLQFLLMAADEISKRIQAELGEAAQAGSL